jgi:hypothetical protein
VIAFDDDTVGVLERHRKQQQADREKWDTESVFPHAAKDAAKATAELVPPQRKATAGQGS